MMQPKQPTKILLISSLSLMSTYCFAQASIANTHSTHQSNVATYLAVGQDDLFINSQTGSSDGKSKKMLNFRLLEDKFFLLLRILNGIEIKSPSFFENKLYF